MGIGRSERSSREYGFTLVELILYVAIFGVAAVFLVGALLAITRIQLKQSSVNEVNAQLIFAANTVQRLVREASLIENETGKASSTLVLRMSPSTADRVKIYVNPADSELYLETVAEGQVSGVPVPITNDRVRVGNFSVTKYQNEGGFAVVQIDLALDSGTANPQAAVSRTWRGAVSRVSAATFDSDLLPGPGVTGRTIGTSASPWDRVFVDDGSDLSPSFTFGRDTSLGIYWAGPGAIGFAAGGGERMRINSLGDVWIQGIAESQDFGHAVCVIDSPPAKRGTLGTCQDRPSNDGSCDCQ